MLNMNRVTLLGRAGRDPDIRTLSGGGKAATFSLATTESWKDREGKTVEATEWHRIVAYATAAEIVEKMVRKGAAVLIEGRLATREYRDRVGNERAVTEIVVAGPRCVVNILSTPGGAADAGTDQARDSGRQQ